MVVEEHFENNTDSAEDIRYFIAEQCRINHIATDKFTKIIICVDEIVSNIIRYSKAKTISVKFSTNDSATVIIYFEDDGIPFDPLNEAKCTDMSVDLKDREIGGLGVFMVKKLMKEVHYYREHNNNIFSILI